MACDYLSLSNSMIQTLQAYQPGKPISEVERELGISNVIKLASNENPLGTGELAKQAAITEMEELYLYPDGSGHILKQKLSQFLKLPENMITLGNGSDSLLSMLIQAYANENKKIMVAEYSFINYIIIAKAHGVAAQMVPASNWNIDVEATVDKVNEQTAIIFIANPNNPTGTYITHQQLSYLLKNVPENILVVVDEAYYEYATAQDYPDSLQLQRDYPNLVITRTFSKAYALAGLRIGYCISNSQIADVLNRIRLPFNVSSPGLSAACAALDDEQHIVNTIATNQRGMVQLTEGFQRLNLEYIPSAANFITVDVRRDTTKLFQQLLQHGIILRPLHPYGMPNHFRVTIGLAEQNQRVIDAFTLLLKE